LVLLTLSTKSNAIKPFL